MAEEKSSTKAETETAATDNGDPSPEQIEAEIEETREELGETVAALAEKADVKKQAKQKAEEIKAGGPGEGRGDRGCGEGEVQAAPEAARRPRTATSRRCARTRCRRSGRSARSLVVAAILRRRRVRARMGRSSSRRSASSAACSPG